MWGFFPRKKKTECLYSLCNDGWQNESLRTLKKVQSKALSFAWPGERQLACHRTQGRQTFQSVPVSKIVNVSGTAHSFIASAKVWYHLSKRLLLV